MSARDRVLLIFASIHHVLAAEAALKAASVPAELVPVPKEISPNCGMAVTVAAGDRERALATLPADAPPRVIEGWEA